MEAPIGILSGGFRGLYYEQQEQVRVFGAVGYVPLNRDLRGYVG